ncbi:hypothetical protein BAY61_04480 [Prauserella marina]|uniref:Uncharacterized protein n=1 Tax=Prauserella marina TaxID=530584 RepID=A0A222VKT6_9PSEU|nr:hypothetical protein [Prauserella marina]ASR34373.1 hypothetical protein BAY61_04480 [Prauserella marina]PWV71835.1 hypothetical protein DES30_1115 [Prauserella marina]SDD88979.1 hypothetical protein SAMN05421630_1144 [Prauserella marina]
MAIQKGHRFPIEFDEAFPQGLVMVGEVSPDNDYQSREERAMGKPARQRVDEVSGKRQWKVTVTDPSESNAKRASYEVTLLADVQPVPAASEVLPGMRPVEFENVTAEPRVAGNGEFKYQSYLFRATGFKAAVSSGRSGGKVANGAADSASKAA